MTDRLEGPRRKLARARRHFEDVRAILAQLEGDNPSYAKQNYNHTEGHYEFSLQDDWALDPDLPLIVGDVLHNARSALDHLAWALARDPGRGTGFPILDPAHPIARNVFYIRKQLATMKRVVKVKLERNQPYKRKRALKSLWWLNQLDIADKHHLVLRTAHNAPGFALMMPDGYDIKPVATLAAGRGTIFAIAIGPFDPKLQWQVKPHIDVVFTHEPVMYYPLDLVLTTILDDIEFKMFAAFSDSDFW